MCEGIGGFRYVNGFPGGRPVRPNLSMGDTVAGIHAALGIVLALFQRERGGSGQVVDVALYEAVFNLLEAIIPEFDATGLVRGPSGSTVTGIVPTNTYRCADGKYVIIGGNGDSIFKRLMVTAERPDLAEDPRLAKNPGRVENEAEIDGAIEAWCATLPSPDVLAKLEANRVPCGPIYSAADMMADPHFQARGLFQQVQAQVDAQAEIAGLDDGDALRGHLDSDLLLGAEPGGADDHGHLLRSTHLNIGQRCRRHGEID